MDLRAAARGRRAAPRHRAGVGALLSVNNSEALRDAALTGLGVAVLPDFTAQKALDGGKLVRLLPQWKPMGPFAEQVFAFRPYAAQVPLGVTLFISFLREVVRRRVCAQAGGGLISALARLVRPRRRARLG